MNTPHRLSDSDNPTVKNLALRLAYRKVTPLENLASQSCHCGYPRWLSGKALFAEAICSAMYVDINLGFRMENIE